MMNVAFKIECFYTSNPGKMIYLDALMVLDPSQKLYEKVVKSDLQYQSEEQGDDHGTLNEQAWQ